MVNNLGMSIKGASIRVIPRFLHHNKSPSIPILIKYGKLLFHNLSYNYPSFFPFYLLLFLLNPILVLIILKFYYDIRCAGPCSPNNSFIFHLLKWVESFSMKSMNLLHPWGKVWEKNREQGSTSLNFGNQ